MGPAVVLVLMLLLLVVAGIMYVALHWRASPLEREGHVFAESRDMDAVVQAAPSDDRGAPTWLRLNLRDGRALLATAEHRADVERLHVRVTAVDADPASPASETPPRLVAVRRWRDGGVLEDAVALLEVDETRVGAAVPAGGPRPFAAPPAYDVHLYGRRYRIEGSRLLVAGVTPTPDDPDAALVGRLFPGPFPRLAWVQWRGPATGAGETREDVALLALLAWWNTSLYRSRVLRLLPAEETAT